MHTCRGTPNQESCATSIRTTPPKAIPILARILCGLAIIIHLPSAPWGTVFGKRQRLGSIKVAGKTNKADEEAIKM